MNEYAKLPLLTRCCLAAGMLLAVFGSTAWAEITGLEVGHVGTSAFTASWSVSDAATVAGIQLYSDAEMTQEVGIPFSVEWFPVDELVPPGLPVGYDLRQQASAVRAAMELRGRILVRVGNLDPGESYYVKALALDNADEIVSEAGPVAVSLAESSSMIRESRQLVLSVTAMDAEAREGALVRVSAAGSPYPLYGVLINDNDAARAVVDLTNFLNGTGTTQREFNSPLDISIELPDLLSEPLVESIPYDGSFVVAAHTPVLYAGQEVAGFVFDVIATKLVQIPFTVTIRAVNSQGELVESYNEPANLVSSGPLAVGAGETPAFSGGILSEYTLRIDEPGTFALEVDEPGGASGISNSFNVLAIYYALDLVAEPPYAGTVSGAGDYLLGLPADIIATANEGFYFDHWTGGTVEDPGDAQTSVQIGGNTSLTAIFYSLLAQTYQEWTIGFFQENASDPEIAGFDRDPESDLVNNLLEFAFGRDPTVQEDSGYRMPFLTTNPDGTMEFHYFRRIAHPELDYGVFQSETLQAGSWSEVLPDAEDISYTAVDDQIELVTIRLPLGTRSYLRVVVSL